MPDLDELLTLGEQVGQRLKARGDTITVAESSAGGLISAALLSVAGASAYFVGGAVVYTRTARTKLLDIPEATFQDIPPSSEAYALTLARAVRARLATTWAIAETGATGPTGNRYGYAAGHACLAVAGPAEAARTLETASPERWANMRAFAASALRLLLEAMPPEKAA